MFPCPPLRLLPLPLLALIGACTTAPPPPATSVAALTPLQTEIRRDLLASAAEKYGQARLDTALAADRFVLAKHYQGLPPPPFDTDGNPIVIRPPVGLAFFADGRWQSFGPAPDPGPRDLAPYWAQQLDAALADPALAAEPEDGGPLGCTDAGGSFLMTKDAGRVRIAKGHCGGSPKTEALVFLALKL